MRICQRIRLYGTVQGVGFRPFVHRLATRRGLAGSVANVADGLEVLVQGPPEDCARFLDELRNKSPVPAAISRMQVDAAPVTDAAGFEIRASDAAAVVSRSQSLSPDLAACHHCVAELFDPHNRRYRYPLISCAHCGPRYTIAAGVPYDRQRTSMARFERCPACRREYEDPLDRRHHAQIIACPDCGPRLDLLDRTGRSAGVGDPIELAARALADGAIVAVKGLGGFHLAVHAGSDAAVQRLRQLKHRPAKPLALMARDLLGVAAVARLNEAEAEIIRSPQRPIVLLAPREDRSVSRFVAPGLTRRGLMLPYTPLHHLLLADFQALVRGPALLVMTSGNISDEPIIHDDAEALSRLGSIADLFLTHDRPILKPCDDSVVQIVGGEVQLLRRARGFVPQPIELPITAARPLLACGAHQKNTFCLAADRHAMLSLHIGDLDSFEAQQAFRRAVGYAVQSTGDALEILTHDLHPDYASTRFARESNGARLIPVQHHHAHVASVIAEHHLPSTVIGVAFDGSGLGSDGSVWGGEFLLADLHRFQRVAHIECFPLPGGEAAVREPWRLAAWWLHRLYGPRFLEWDLPLIRQIDPAAWRIIQRIADEGLNSPLTSSMGRLFDVAAALILGQAAVHHEGEAAMRLEAIAEPGLDPTWRFEVVDTEPLVIRPDTVIRGVVEDLRSEQPAERVAGRFHAAVAKMIQQVCDLLRRREGLETVALSGGVFQNALLLSTTMDLLRRDGLAVYTNRHVPPNDGGLSFGQAAVTAAMLSNPTCV